MTKEEYQDFVLRYKGCGACFPLYEKLSKFEKMWFTAIQKDVAELKLKLEALEGETPWKDIKDKSELIKENTELKALLNCNNCSELAEEECEVCAEYSHFKCKRKDQLIKAKNIIIRLLEALIVIDGEETRELKEVKEAEQFLNSEVEK